MDLANHGLARSVKGLKYTIYGLTMFILWQLTWIAVLYSLRDVLTDLTTDAMLDNILPLCGSLLIMFISLFFILLGLIYLISGREELGETHNRNVIIGVLCLVLGFIIAISLAAIPTQARAGANTAAAVLYSLGFIYLLKELLGPNEFKLLIMGGFILIAINASNAILVGVNLSTDTDMFSSPDAAITVIFTFMILSIIPWAIFLISFYRAWKHMEQQVVATVPQGKLDANNTIISTSTASKTQIPYPVKNHPGKCPSCGLALQGNEPECPNCGYYFGAH